ncbi:hypothetical protein GCM10009768_27550 [Leucobacter iarius]|uniref:Uncharacterized protein n=1 Tax=Leucobacter iarius TaxID=333963 RepID=A0ABN2LQS9_9MICO
MGPVDRVVAASEPSALRAELSSSAASTTSSSRDHPSYALSRDYVIRLFAKKNQISLQFNLE